jgi:hypothetical protein
MESNLLPIFANILVIGKNNHITLEGSQPKAIEQNLGSQPSEGIRKATQQKLYNSFGVIFDENWLHIIGATHHKNTNNDPAYPPEFIRMHFWVNISSLCKSGIKLKNKQEFPIEEIIENKEGKFRKIDIFTLKNLNLDPTLSGVCV